MSVTSTPTKGTKAGGWTDRELLVYLFGLVEYSQVKLDIKNAPRPNGRTVRACEQKIQGLKSHLKVDLEALRSGAPVSAGDGTPVAKKGRKRKGDDDGDVQGTPTKRGRTKKMDAETEIDEDDEETIDVKVKSEIKDEVDILEEEV
ncbi:hypothetical protein IAQ61_006805 [Plenodomus lingam]|uniref:Myb-like domain-containing protein n=1 Tax=Leptosphaeria maculans (strain JN3 / isolate v23.1.3 / race Av1-4-5-6-7-8) TaxID=985895 RepID=E5ACL7_LEPMJ|nr:hypothetical protein LEMA_P010060.1 [Plenodomus lingam JN3]KAH9869597.1 hypothetical protein IAQ61_006805 [Plenodomus lingam]CBY02219.1 hypothetical protein LEMA_P010060.1 [Plenodomus lingam JN3]